MSSFVCMTAMLLKPPKKDKEEDKELTAFPFQPVP